MVTCVLHGTCHCCKARVLNGSTGPFSTGADSGNNSDQSKLGWEPVPLLLPDPRRPASDLCSPFDFLISLAVSLFFFFFFPISPPLLEKHLRLPSSAELL